MLSIIISSLAGFISFMILDYLWLAKIAKNFYLSSLAGHTTIKDGSLVPYVPAVPIVYLIAILGILIFVIPKATTSLNAFLYGALMGFVMYAFYDFTNLATLKDYPWSITIVDTLWGTLLVGVVSFVIFFVQSLFA
jgi:uncharacterized membrane protein